MAWEQSALVDSQATTFIATDPLERSGERRTAMAAVTEC